MATLRFARRLLSLCLVIATGGCSDFFRDGRGSVGEDSTFTKVAATTYSVAANTGQQMWAPGHTYDMFPASVRCAYLSVGQKTATQFQTTMRDCATGQPIAIASTYYFDWIIVSQTKILP